MDSAPHVGSIGKAIDIGFDVFSAKLEPHRDGRSAV